MIVKIDINILYGLRREKYWPDVIERGDGALPHAHIHTPYRTTWIKLLKEGENIINVSVWYFIFVTGRFKFIHTPISCLKVLFKSFDIYIYIAAVAICSSLQYVLYHCETHIKKRAPSGRGAPSRCRTFLLKPRVLKNVGVERKITLRDSSMFIQIQFKIGNGRASCPLTNSPAESNVMAFLQVATTP